MEDRLTPGLFLAFGETARPLPDATSGVERVSVWEDARPGRRDLPRTLPDFPLLTLHEVTDAFAAPADVDDAYWFRRYPRPSQGIVTGRPTTGLLVVLITPRTPDDAPRLRDWADFVHIREIAAASVPGYTCITPYEHAGRGEPRFLHLYEIDDGDPEEVFASMNGYVEARVGPAGSAAWKAWAFDASLRIDYVATYRRVA